MGLAASPVVLAFYVELSTKPYCSAADSTSSKKQLLSLLGTLKVHAVVLLKLLSEEEPASFLQHILCA